MSQLAACVELGSRSRFNPFAKFEKTGSVHSIGSGIDSGSIDRNAHSMIARQAVDVLVKK